MSANSGLPKLRVLVVDDHEESALSMAFLLRVCGHETRSAFDGPTALSEATAEAPDVVLLDLDMPGMDGFEVASRLREGCGASPPVVVAVTGLSGDEVRRKTLDSGIVLHLVKPVDARELLALLERVRAFVGDL